MNRFQNNNQQKPVTPTPIKPTFTSQKNIKVQLTSVVKHVLQANQHFLLTIVITSDMERYEIDLNNTPNVIKSNEKINEDINEYDYFYPLVETDNESSCYFNNGTI